MKAPFPWFGGKRKVAPLVWAALGDVAHYVEPFFGSGAVLLQRPHKARLETANDADGLLSNFWRAVRADPQAVAHHADWPCNEADLHARHLWLVGQRERITERLMGDPEFFDAKVAGWWVWGLCNWIGNGWCDGSGPWGAVDGVLTDSRLGQGDGGISRGLPHLGDNGQGISRGLPHLSPPRGINREQECGRRQFIDNWFSALADRLRDVRVACGDWTRVTGPSVLRAGYGVTGVFLDPPYCTSERAAVYAHESDVARDVLEWCREHGDNARLRIVLAGYDGEHNSLEAGGWRCVGWKGRGGYGNRGDGRGRENAKRERLWFSPHCIDAAPTLFSRIEL